MAADIAADIRVLLDKLGQTTNQISSMLNAVQNGQLSEFLLSKAALTTYVFGGAIRDILLEKAPFMISICLRSIPAGKISSREQFNLLIVQFASLNGLNCVDNPPYHLSLSRPGSGVLFDIHYPDRSVLSAVSRSDLTINGIAYNCQSKAMEYPFGGSSRP